MRKLFILMASFAISIMSMAQKKITIAKVDFTSAVAAPHKVTPPPITLKASQVKEFSKKTSDKLIIELQNIPPAAIVGLKTGEALVDEGGVKYFDVTKAIRSAIKESDGEEPSIDFKITYAPTAAAAPINSGVINISWEPIAKENKNSEVIIQGKKNRDKIIQGFKANAAFNNPYDSKNNRVDLFFDENGRLLNYLPVNTDQNDIFYLHILCEKGDEEKYRVKITEGEYAPSDLSIRPFTKITEPTGSSTEEEEIAVAKEYTSIILHSGPYTSDNFKFQISYDSSGTDKNGLLYSIKINKLFHVGVGVSIISSGLEAPDYKTYFNGTDTTIQAFNGKRRTLFTFNVIWYWTIFHQKKEGSDIPNGRDVLKDEASFSMTRLFPTIGVTIDNNFKENFFLGGVYEFARGGSFTAGLHYGRINVLKDEKFELGKTKFSGNDADIKLDKVYKPGFYIGLNVDTRILNLLFSKGK